MDCLDKKREYMRDWKKRNYANNKDNIQVINKNHYYKTKYGCNEEDKELFGIYLGDCLKLRKLLADLRKKDEGVFSVLINEINI
jgi:hypothetical protein|tara:strand:- start:4096 stop:4347 length:252 start_codon:yes stop_codon:yes gene_type:complete